jgi:hypothetical protein
MDLPLESVVDAELGEKIHHVRVRAKENVKAGLDPVAIGILPGGDLSAEHIAGLVDNRLMAGINKVLSGRQS